MSRGLTHFPSHSIFFYIYGCDPIHTNLTITPIASRTVNKTHVYIIQTFNLFKHLHVIQMNEFYSCHFVILSSPVVCSFLLLYFFFQVFPLLQQTFNSLLTKTQGFSEKKSNISKNILDKPQVIELIWRKKKGSKSV